MASAAAAVGAAIRRVTSHLMAANAVSPESAIYFVPDRRLQRRVLPRLMRRGVVVETKPDTYYLDVPAYEAWRSRTRKRAAIGVGAVIVAAAVAALLA
jgi:hypothetical protein